MPPTRSPLANAFTLTEKFRSAAFTSRDARELQVTARQLQTLAAAGLVQRLHRDSYVVAAEFTSAADAIDRHRIECQAVNLVLPTAAISHESAALIHGLPVGRTFGRAAAGERVQVTIDGEHRGNQPGYDVSGSALPESDIALLDGIRVTTVERTGVDLARRQRMPDGQMPIDAAARIIVDQLAGPDADLRLAVHDDDLRQAALQRLRDVCDPMKGWKGVGFARQAIRLAEPASESALESISRVHMFTAGLPMPRSGWPVEGDSGMRYWADFYWPEFKLIGEADGALKYSTQDRVLAERTRQRDLEDRGFTIVRWNWHQAVVDPSLMITLLRRELDRLSRANTTRINI